MQRFGERKDQRYMKLLSPVTCLYTRGILKLSGKCLAMLGRQSIGCNCDDIFDLRSHVGKFKPQGFVFLMFRAIPQAALPAKRLRT